MTDARENAESDSAANKAATKVARRGPRRLLLDVKLVPVVLVLLTLVSGGLATWLYFNQYRPDQQTDPGVARVVVGAASDGTVALLSYSPESLDKDFATARSHLSGDFLSYYNDFSQQVVAPAAREKSLKTTAHVVGAALSELRPDSAVVVVFVDQMTTSKDTPSPAMSPSSVLVRMARVNGSWLIVKFDPV
jgi:Mce-associated membrane protein